MMITIEQLKALNQFEKIAITEHARIRLYERKISVDDIINGINTGGKKGAIIMVCMECGAKAERGYTTSVTDLGSCLLIVRIIAVLHKGKAA